MQRFIGSHTLLHLLVLAAACLPLPLLGNEPASVRLAERGAAKHSIVISSKASDAVKKSSRDLADYLGRISGGTFKVEIGDGSRGIVLGSPAEFENLPFEIAFGKGPFEREEYILRSHASGLYLIGASDLAVSHAVWDLLYRLGYRQFFPGEIWEVVPQQNDLRIAIDAQEKPSFYARRIWYNWGTWGYNDEPYRQWCQRNRAVKGFDLSSGHAYEQIIAANRADFDKHPEYYALVQGERKLRPDVKFCISNPALRKLVTDHAVRTFQAQPQFDSVSMDPSDGGNWCECDECNKLGSVSNRVVTLANDVAVAINELGLGDKYVGMYAYNQHSAPPTIKVHSKVIPSATTAFIGGGFTFDQVVEGWQKQGATMGVYDYLSVVDWDWNLPRGGGASRPLNLAKFLPHIYSQAVRFYDAESGDCWGPCGLGYYFASRALWNVKEAEQFDKIFEDFLDKAFVEAKEPMREFYRLINLDTQRRPPSDLIGRMYRQLAAARKATQNAKVLERIDHLTLYTRHAELYYAFAGGNGSKDDVVKHAYRMRKTMMIHSYGLWSRLLSQQAALTPDHPLKNETPFSREELDQILAEGQRKNVPVDPGFEGKEYSRNLMPAAERLGLPKVPAGSFPTSAQDHQQYYLWVPEKGGQVDLSITVQKLWANRLPKLSLFSPQDVSLNAVATEESYQADGQERAIKLKTPYSGLHRIETWDGGDYTRIKWPSSMPVTIETGIESPDVTSHFRGPWTMYFYVPKGTKVIGGWASRIANWAPRISGKLIDPEAKTAIDFSEQEEGWFKAEVGPGQDGKLWKFEDSQGQRLLMTVPPYVARSGEALLLPEEVVAADEKE